jgi:tRNA threonylcarbamoyladenosine biosynthesis protein TsaE
MKYHLSEIDKAADYVLACAEADTLLFNAAMGSGKTTLITAICKRLGVAAQEISSPTFSLVNEYEGKNTIVYHFDLYRIKQLDELYDIGVEEYLTAKAMKFVEWPDLILPLVDDFQTVEISIIDDQSREVRVSDVVYR